MTNPSSATPTAAETIAVALWGKNTNDCDELAAAALSALVTAGFAVVRRSAVVDAIQWRDWHAVRALLPAASLPTTKEQR